MNELDMEWVEKCKDSSDRYKIYVDNDEIFVEDAELDQCVYTFCNYGYEFIVELLNYIGCDADCV